MVSYVMIHRLLLSPFRHLATTQLAMSQTPSIGKNMFGSSSSRPPASHDLISVPYFPCPRWSNVYRACIVLLHAITSTAVCQMSSNGLERQSWRGFWNWGYPSIKKFCCWGLQVLFPGMFGQLAWIIQDYGFACLIDVWVTIMNSS